MSGEYPGAQVFYGPDQVQFIADAVVYIAGTPVRAHGRDDLCDLSAYHYLTFGLCITIVHVPGRGCQQEENDVNSGYSDVDIGVMSLGDTSQQQDEGQAGAAGEEEFDKGRLFFFDQLEVVCRYPGSTFPEGGMGVFSFQEDITLPADVQYHILIREAGYAADDGLVITAALFEEKASVG